MNDESSNPGRSYFTLRELLVVATIIALGFAVLVPMIRSARQRSQRTECKNNLMYISLGIQKFHDIRREICPSYLTNDHTPAALPTGFATWPLLVRPFMDTGLHEDVHPAFPLDQPAPLPADHKRIVRETMSVWVCPSRRVPSGSFPNSPFAVGDYGNVSLAEASDEVIRAEPRTWDAAMLPSRVFSDSTVALYGFPPGNYRSMTNFSGVTDGLSNTIFIGEKAVHADRLGKDASYLGNAALPSHQDGTFYYGRGGKPANLAQPGEMAFWSRRLAPAHAGERLLPAKARLENPDNRFGGWHEGVTLFLMGDGQVKALSNDTSSLVLQRLGSRNDGQKVDLP